MRRLIVGIIRHGEVYPYEGNFRPVEATYETDEKYFELTSELLQGRQFQIVVELIAVNGSRTIFEDRMEYELKVEPPTFNLQKGHGPMNPPPILEGT